MSVALEPFPTSPLSQPSSRERELRPAETLISCSSYPTNLNPTIFLSSTHSTFVYSVQPLPFSNLDPSTLPPLFNNDTAVGVYETGLTYEASYGSGNGITKTL